MIQLGFFICSGLVKPDKTDLMFYVLRSSTDQYWRLTDRCESGLLLISDSISTDRFLFYETIKNLYLLCLQYLSASFSIFTEYDISNKNTYIQNYPNINCSEFPFSSSSCRLTRRLRTCRVLKQFAEILWCLAMAHYWTFFVDPFLLFLLNYI